MILQKIKKYPQQVARKVSLLSQRKYHLTQQVYEKGETYARFQRFLYYGSGWQKCNS